MSIAVFRDRSLFSLLGCCAAWSRHEARLASTMLFLSPKKNVQTACTFHRIRPAPVAAICLRIWNAIARLQAKELNKAIHDLKLVITESIVFLQNKNFKHQYGIKRRTATPEWVFILLKKNYQGVLFFSLLLIIS